MKSLTQLTLIGLVTVGAAGCAQQHEALITGPTQCFAPHGFGPQASSVAQSSVLGQSGSAVSDHAVASNTAL